MRRQSVKGRNRTRTTPRLATSRKQSSSTATCFTILLVAAISNALVHALMDPGLRAAVSTTLLRPFSCPSISSPRSGAGCCATVVKPFYLCSCGGIGTSTVVAATRFRGGGRTMASTSTSDGGGAAPPEKDEPRTGWLHNTKPKTSIATEANQPAESAAQRMLRLEKAKRLRNHRIVSPPVFHPCGGERRAVVTEHMIAVPVTRGEPVGAGTGVGTAGTIDVFFTVAELAKTEADEKFFRSLVSASATTRADLYVSHAKMADASDMILYLQGGPGFGCPAPVVGLGLAEKASWAAEALKTFRRVVLMDQRGTGRSTPITKQSLQRCFPDLFALDDRAASAIHVAEHEQMAVERGIDGSLPFIVADQLDAWSETEPELAARVGVALGRASEFMSNFRADNIVRDAEAVKDVLLLPREEEAEDVPRPWGAALGQSFGGFCMMTYLSQIPYPPKICLLTGGIAPMLTPVFDVYDSLWDRVKERNLRYYELYPGDIQVVKRIVRRLLDEPETLPSGGKLTARRFLQLGLGLGGSPSSFASLHSLLASAFLDGDDEDDDIQFTRAFLKRIDAEQNFDDHPIYFLLHESIYADGTESSPTDWAAHRAFEQRIQTPSEFSYELTAKLESDARPTLFFGEMVFPWMADGDFAELSGFGMRALAQSLNENGDWGALFDADHMRSILADGGRSKAAAAVYFDDMYVDFDACMKCTKRGGPLEKCKVWITNEYQHSGLRDNGAEIFTKLLGMAKGTVGTPS